MAAAEKPKYETKISLRGPAGNIFAVLSTATKLLSILDEPNSAIRALQGAVWGSKSYDEALDHIERYFPLVGRPTRAENSS